MSDRSQSHPTPILAEDALLRQPAVRWLCWALYVGTILAVAGVRWTGGAFPGDLSAYLAAVDVFADGGNPYTDALTTSTFFDGYPFVYPPGTLYLLWPLEWLGPRAAAACHILLAGSTLGYTVWSLDRRFELGLPLGPTLLACVLFGPVTVDLMVGNLGVFLLGATAATADLADTTFGPRVGVALTVLGLVYAFKVMWLAPAVLLLVAGRRWRHLLCLALGLGLVAGLSALHPGMVGDWLARIQWVRQNFPDSLDLVSLAPWFYPVAVVTWLVIAVRAVRRSTEAAWLVGCLSLFAWPRLAPYSFTLALPPVFFLLRRYPPRRVVLLPLLMWGPCYWLVAMPPGTSLARWTHLLWMVAVAGATWAALRSSNWTS